jgi:hypothetical protein
MGAERRQQVVMRRKEAVVVVIKKVKKGHDSSICARFASDSGMVYQKETDEARKHSLKKSNGNALQALTSAALLLPGLFCNLALAADGDEVDFHYSHYQESERNISSAVINPLSGDNAVAEIKNSLNPIEVDSIFGRSKVTLTDRIKFAFNYTQDTWGGATPITTAPAVFGANAELVPANGNTVVGASPYLQGVNQILLDRKLNPVYSQIPFDSSSRLIRNNQLSHTLATASPETRRQGDFKLTYEWDEAALSVGGGISVEDDYESRFGNIGGKWDLNQKLTTLNLDLSYTNSDTNATLSHDTLPYLDIKAYELRGQIDTVSSKANANILQANRQDWGTHFGVTQVLNKDALASADVSYTRSTGYMANPYKAVSVVFIDPEEQSNAPPGGFEGRLKALLEQRPDVRNQWNLGGRYVQLINSMDAALHFDYRFSADDWGIQAHTFEADWVQPLGDGWTVTPKIRYYSQDAADFYTPWLVSQQAYRQRFDANGNPVGLSYDPRKLPANFSSDQRLSGFGALSGSVSINKKLTKGLSLETGFEYYTHQGSFKIGGGGESSFADFDYWVANAALKVDLAALSQAGSGDISHAQHHQHSAHAPAGVMFDHMLPEAGDFMVGYRYMYSNQSGDMLHGTNPAGDQAVVANACGNSPCFLKPGGMSMHMHMLDLMYAPTDWLTLMLMPQFVDMSMTMDQLGGTPDPQTVFDFNLSQHITHHTQNGHQTGGIGDLGMYALFKLFDNGIHHIHATAGLSAPTGDVNNQLVRNHQVDGGFIDYGMQLGSGTWDFKPSLTYTGHIDQWSWGAQANGTVRMENRNESGYALGDMFQATAWGNYSLTNWLTASVRGLYTLQGGIQGQYNGLINQFGPVDYPENYGGKYWDVGFGLSATVPSGDLAGNRFSVEWLQPVEDDVNGYQLKRDGALSATWSLAF